MKSFLFTQPGIFKMGFTNQIFSLITAIIVSIRDKKKIIIVDNFVKDHINSHLTLSCSELINLELLNNFLKKYNIIIFDKYNYVFNIQNVCKIVENERIDISSYFNENNNINDIIYFNNSPNKIVVTYTINNFTFEDYYEQNEEIKYNFNEVIYYNHFGMKESYDANLFEEILLNIKYNDVFNDYANSFFQNIISNKLPNELRPINVIHLRIEADGICHWSKQNNMSSDEYFDYIVEKYIDLIKKYIDKNSENIILTHNPDNKIVHFMKENDYIVHYIDKTNFNGRELNAIYDLLIGKYCNNIFIENDGSTFSYYLSKLLPSNVKRISIDINNIKECEKII